MFLHLSNFLRPTTPSFQTRIHDPHISNQIDGLGGLETVRPRTIRPLSRARPNIGFGAETAKFLGLGYGRNSKFSFGIVTASRNSDIEFGKHRFISQPFPKAVFA